MGKWKVFSFSASQVEQQGLGNTFRNHAGTVFVRALAKIEVRQVIDGFLREEPGALADWPSLELVGATSGAAERSHAGLAMADLGCNYVYGQLAPGTPPGATLEELTRAGRPPLIVGRDALPRLRRLDRALRASPPDLVRACRAVTALEGDAATTASTTSLLRLPRVGSALAARDLHDGGLRALTYQHLSLEQDAALPGIG